jgi:tetratricopeptide (TPR) repeat protein
VLAAALGLVVAVFAAYANTLHAPFVYDDALAIPDNPSIRQLSHLGDILLPQSAGGLTVSGRPVLNLSFALNYALGGNAVTGYHVVNILIHAGAALLLFGLLRRTLARWPAPTPAALRPTEATSGKSAVATPPVLLAGAIAALWALHPLQTQAVTYTVQRAESLMGFFYLLTLYAFARATSEAPAPGAAGVSLDTHRTRHRWFAVSVAACLLGMGTKEVMASAPLLVFLYDRTFVAGSFRAAWQQRRGYYLALAGTWILLAALVLSTGGNRGGTAGLGVGVPLWAYPLTQFKALAHYLWLSVWPHPLVFEYGTFWVERAGDLVPYALVVLPLLGGTLWALRKKPVLGFAGAWFFVILAPTSLTPGTIQMIVEHRMYLPLAAVLATLLLGLHRWLGARAAVLGLGLAAVLAVATGLRNRDYRSHLALWSETVAQRPLNPRAHEGLAEAYTELGQLEQAIAHHAESARLLPDEAHYQYNLARALAEAGRFAEAVLHYRHSLRLEPKEARTHNNLAIALGRLGQGEEALTHYVEAERLDPRDAQAPYNHGIALLRLGRTAEAIPRYEAALRLRPDYADAHFNLASALASLGRLPEALPHYEAALRERPDDPEFRLTYAGALLVSGRPQDALAQVRTVLAARPQHAPALFAQGNALAALRRSGEAAASYEAALRADPNQPNAHYKLGNLLIDLDRVSEALIHYEAAVRLNPADAEAQHNLGIAYARLDRFPEAGRAFETALRLKPDYPDARRHLEQVRSLLGR